MATYKGIEPSDINVATSFLNQLIDVIQEDISSSVSRRKYQVFVTGGLGPGVTSSLFQTVYDQDFTLQTANAVFDCTVGIFPESTIATDIQEGVDSANKEKFPSSSLMMREKLDNYRQFAQVLLGDADLPFTLPYGGSTTTNINAAMFLAFKRLFSRDSIKRETFAMKFYQTASLYDPLNSEPNLWTTSEEGESIYYDAGAGVNKFTEFGGTVANIFDASNTSNAVGMLFYERGIAVFDLEKITSGTQFVSGTIDAVNVGGTIDLGGPGTETATTSKFIPDFLCSGSIDDIVDHLCATRFSSGSMSAITFQNITNINSTLVFCKASADEFNYSSNPTFTDASDNIVVIDPGQEDVQQTFTFITSVGLYDSNDNLLAVAKLSRPVEKNPERELTFRVRLDF